MNPIDRRIRPAFTLVELIIVIAILGILAAIVVPRFSSATDTARANGALSQLVTVRKQLEVWKLDHDDAYPTLDQLQIGASDWAVLTGRTDGNGDPAPAGDKGPYFPNPPVNPYTNSSLIVAAGAPVPSAGWTYDETTGIIRLILPAAVNPQATELAQGDFEQPAD